MGLFSCRRERGSGDSPALQLKKKEDEQRAKEEELARKQSELEEQNQKQG